MLQTVFFYILSLGAVVCAVGVVTARSAVYSVLSLVATMCFMAGLFVLLNAFFIAAIQILVYAGAILVLFLFIVMLIDARQVEAGSHGFGATPLIAGVVAVSFLGLAIQLIRKIPVVKNVASHGDPVEIGRLLFNNYVLPFELTSLLLLAAVVSIVVLAEKEPS